MENAPGLKNAVATKVTRCRRKGSAKRFAAKAVSMAIVLPPKFATARKDTRKKKATARRHAQGSVFNIILAYLNAISISRGCQDGVCISPDVCQCNKGWSLDATGTKCFAACDKPCLNGICSG